MTSSKPVPQQLQARVIRRRQVQQSLAISAFIAVLLVSGCDNPTPTPPVNPKVSALFYENTAQCQVDAKKQQAEYSVLSKAYQRKELAAVPKAPAFKVADCAPQMLAAQQEYNRNAPVYRSLADCQGDGVQCEPTPAGYPSVGYRPTFGGSYFYPDGNAGVGVSSVSYQGQNRIVYQPRTVYRSSTNGKVVTPQGEVLSKTNPGLVSVSKNTTISAPARPQGYTARGTIKGRSTSGFGSTFKSTGRGGK